MTYAFEHTVPTLGAPTEASTLVALAHPDDEFLVGGLLDLLHANNVTTHAVIATDGEASDRGDPEDLRNFQRRYEAGKALARYGIRMENQHFLGLPDGALSANEHINTVAYSVGRLLAEYPIRTVVTLGHYGYDDHADHIAIHTAAESAVSSYATANPNLQLYGLTHSETDIRVPADAKEKLRRLAHHQSQFDIDVSDPSYQPTPGTVEQPGIQLSEASRGYLARYFNNMHLERYDSYTLRS
jgi:LmbE family N-acetylglucosaminyl deacetylase